jgi:CDGSH-type Zn-finger protein
MSSARPSEKAVITPYEDGPYLIRGTFSVCDQEGNPIDVARRTVALCRCGRSRSRPFCDGTHRLVGFRAPSGREPWPEDDQALEMLAGGEPGRDRS